MSETSPVQPGLECGRRQLFGMALGGVLGTGPLSFAAVATDAPPAPRRTHLEVQFSSSVLGAVNRNDVLAAMRVWVETVGQIKGFALDCQTGVLDDIAEFRKQLPHRTTGLVLLDAKEYSEVADSGYLEAIFLASRRKGALPAQFLLLARQESGNTAVAALRGKPLVLLAYNRADLGRKWLELLLHEQGLGPAGGFFSSIQNVAAASASVLPVFFGRAGAGVSDIASFEVMKEFNPQLGSKLQVVAMSPPVVDGILCLDTRHLPYRTELIEALRTLHERPWAGKSSWPSRRTSWFRSTRGCWDKCAASSWTTSACTLRAPGPRGEQPRAVRNLPARLEGNRDDCWFLPAGAALSGSGGLAADPHNQAGGSCPCADRAAASDPARLCLQRQSFRPGQPGRRDPCCPDVGQHGREEQGVSGGPDRGCH